MPSAGALAATGRLAQAEAAPVLATVDRSVFVTLPSPGYLAAAGSALSSAADLDAARAAGAALAAILRDEITALAADGVLYVALENPLYAPLLTVDGRAAAAAAGVDVPAALAALIEADRAVFAGLGVPADFRVGLDLTDSGPLATTASGYDATAVAALLDETPFPRISVDYPADPAARFPVELVKPGIVVSLGAVDVSTAALESVEEILGRIDPVADERGDADIAVATNGGFAQVADQPLMSEPEQRAKLQLVEVVAALLLGKRDLSRGHCSGTPCGVPRGRPCRSRRSGHGRPSGRDWRWSACCRTPRAAAHPGAGSRQVPGSAAGSPAYAKCRSARPLPVR